MSAGKRLRVIVEADGGARGNPGPAGYGAVVREAGTGEVLVERAAALGVTTNNVAEYSGLIAGLQAAADVGAVEVEVRMDSKLVVEQMSGRWRVRHPGLRPLAAQAAALVRRFTRVRFTWVPRERNRRADALANAAMDGQAVGEGDLAAPPEHAGGAQTRPAQPPGEGPNASQRRSVEPPRGAWMPPVQMAARLILVRHAETALTAQRRYSGRGDVELSARGLSQAEAVAARVRALAETVTDVVTSPLRRCARTAEAISLANGNPPVRVEPDLVECDFGAWEGLTFAEVRAGWPEDLDAWLASTALAPPGGESFDSVATRVRGAAQRLLAGLAGQTTVVVSHVTPIKLILRDALGATDAILHRLYLDPAGISIVDSWPDGAVAVRTVNDTGHLRSG